MKIVVNGKDQDISVQNLDQLIRHFKLEPKKVVVELNRRIVRREDLLNVNLKEKDSVEIVELVGGG